MRNRSKQFEQPRKKAFSPSAKIALSSFKTLSGARKTSSVKPVDAVMKPMATMASIDRLNKLTEKYTKVVLKTNRGTKSLMD